jgi:hypothetical protein
MAVAAEHLHLSEHLNAYLDGNLDAALREQMDQHVLACAVCQLELEQLGATRAALRALAPLRAPRPFTVTRPAESPSVAARLASLLPWVWRLGSVATAGCLLLALVTGLSAPGALSSPSAAVAPEPPASFAATRAGSGVAASQGASDRAAAPPAAANRSNVPSSGAAGVAPAASGPQIESAPKAAPAADAREASPATPAQDTAIQASSRRLQPEPASLLASPTAWLTLALLFGAGSAAAFFLGRRIG